MDTDDLDIKSLETGGTLAPDHHENDQQKEYLRQFNTEFPELLDSRSSSGRLLYVFVRRTLQAFHLSGTYKEAFVLNETYLRGISQIHKGEVIKNLPAWVRKTAYNVVRELKRDQQKAVPFEEHQHVLEADQSSISSEDLEDDLATLRMAFQLLDPQDQKLLNLKVVEGLSWREIREILYREGRGDHTESVLRKRKERALLRLRKKYHAIKPPEFPQRTGRFSSEL